MEKNNSKAAKKKDSSKNNVKTKKVVAVRQVKKVSKVFEVLTKEYKYENLFLLVVAIISLAFGAMVISGDLDVKPEVPVVGAYPILFAWVLISVSVIGLLIVAFPFYQPSFGEFSKITWATYKSFITDFARVFIFIIFVSFAFMFYDIILRKLAVYING